MIRASFVCNQSSSVQMAQKNGQKVAQKPICLNNFIFVFLLKIANIFYRDKSIRCAQFHAVFIQPNCVVQPYCAHRKQQANLIIIIIKVADDCQFQLQIRWTCTLSIGIHSKLQTTFTVRMTFRSSAR